MSMAKHYTEWSKEDKDALATQRMEQMKKKNEELKRRYAEVEADRKEAEQQNSSVTLAIKTKSSPVGQDSSFHEDSSLKTRRSGCEDCNDVSKRNSRNPEFVKRSNMSEREKSDYEKWKAERKKIDEERIARHKVKREWDENKVEQEPEIKPLSSGFYREPNWISKQDDRPRRRDFSQRGHYHGNDRGHFKSSRQNYESEDADWQDKPDKFLTRSGSKDSPCDKFCRPSQSDDEDNRCGSRHQKLNYADSLKKKQDGAIRYNCHSRSQFGGFSQSSRNDYYKPNSIPQSDQKNSFPSKPNITELNRVHTSKVHTLSNNCTDKRNDDQDSICRSRFQVNDGTHAKCKISKQSSGTWSSDEGTKCDRSGTKQGSSNWSDDDGDCSIRKTNEQGHLAKHGSFLKCKQNFGNTWSESKPQQSLGSCWSDEDSSTNYAKTSVKTCSNVKNSTFQKCKKKSHGGTWSDDDGGEESLNRTNSQPSHKDNSVVAQTKHIPGTWSDDDSFDVKHHVKSSCSVVLKDVSSGGTWSDVEENEDSACKSGNDSNWLDISDKSENSSSKCGESRKWVGKQLSVNFSAGRGKKWSFEPSRQYNSCEFKNGSCGSYDEQKSGNRAVTLSTDHTLTVTVNDIKGNKPFSQWGVRNSESHYRNTERSQVPSSSLSVTDKRKVKDNEPCLLQRYGDSHRFQANSKNLSRNRGSALRNSSFSSAVSENSLEGTLPQKYKDRSLGGSTSPGGFQRSSSFGRNAKKYGEARRYSGSSKVQNVNSSSEENEKLVECWGDIGKESSVTVCSEDIWGDQEYSENADSSILWTDDSTGNNQCLKSDGLKAEDSSKAGNYDKNTLCTLELGTNDQIKGDNNKIDFNRNSKGNKQRNPVVKSHEIISGNIKIDTHESEQSPVHECMANTENTGNESHDDSSWVTTSGDEFEEELGEEYIDDDESLRISTVQQYDYGDDTSSPEPVPNFVCSMKEYLILAKTAEAYDAQDKTVTEQVPEIMTSENIRDDKLCSTHRFKNLDIAETMLHPEGSILSNDKNSMERLPVVESEPNSVTESYPHSEVNIVSTTITDDQEFLSKGEAQVDISAVRELSVDNYCKNTSGLSNDGGEDQKVMIPKVQRSEQATISSADCRLISIDESCKAIYSQADLESAYEKTDKLEGQDNNKSDLSVNSDSSVCRDIVIANKLFNSIENSQETNISNLESVYEEIYEEKDSEANTEPSKNNELPLCSEIQCTFSIANSVSDYNCSGHLHEISALSDIPKPMKSIFCETSSPTDTKFTNALEELSESSELQRSIKGNVDKGTSSMDVASNDSATCEDDNGNLVLSEEKRSCEYICNKQENESE